jgi:uncharacterized protein (TIGR03085 family)
MSTRPLDAIERDELCDLFLELGPEAPTLCEGWDTLDLAAHLVVRERDPRSGLAILGGDRFNKLETRLMDGARSKGYEALVAKLRSGPPLVPWRLPGARTALNLNEWFVHHEDVRRANGEAPRPAQTRLDAALWANLGRTSRFMVRGLKDTGLVIEAPGFGAKTLRKGDNSVTLVGTPQDLTLYLNGRRGAAQVEADGDDTALAALTDARLGI